MFGGYLSEPEERSIILRLKNRLDINLLKINSSHLLFFLLCYFIIATLFTDESSYRAYFSFGLIILLPFIILLNSTSKASRPIVIANLSKGFGLACLLFLVYMLVMIVAYVGDIRVPFDINIKYFFLSVGGILATLNLLAIFRDTEKERKIITFFIMALSIISLYKIYTTRSLTVLAKYDDNIVTNWALVPAGLFPFIFYIKSQRIRIALLIVILVSVILGNKRSGLIAIVLSTVIIGLYVILLRRQLINFRYFITLLIISFLIFVSYYLYSDFYLNSYLRIMNISEDGGSGRVGIWLEIERFINVASWENLLFGGGANYYTVAVNPNISSPHNDFLAMFISYGIFGAIFYLFVLTRLIFFVAKNAVKRSELTIFSISFLILFIVMSNVSGVFSYYTNYFAFFVGFVILELNSRRSYLHIKT